MNGTNRDNKENNHVGALIMAIICVPVIACLLYNGYQKSQQSGIQTTACQEQCAKQGYAGYDFKWPMFSGPQCACIGARE